MDLRMEIMIDKKTQADNYIKLNSHNIDGAEQRFDFHVAAQTGWINDPNGFSWYNGKIHLFYQHNPYANVWGPMHWGHVTGTDFVKFKHENIALAPDEPDYDLELGAFSGSAIEFKGKYYLVYTGCNNGRQTQCISISDDGINFTKYKGNPVISEKDLPENSVITDFRDPKVWEHEGKVYMIVSAKNKSDSWSRLLLYSTSNMTEWKYNGVIFSNSEEYTSSLGRMLECPDIFALDGKYIIAASPQGVSGHRNNDSNIYLAGDLNYETGALENAPKENVREIDNGLDFYAPQTMLMPDGRRIMVAWMATWSRKPITALLGFGYAGALTFPRELRLHSGKLYQNPVHEIERYFADKLQKQIDLQAGETQYIDGADGKVQDIIIEFDVSDGKTGISVFDDGDGNGLKVYYEKGKVYLNRSGVVRDFYSDETAKTAVCDIPPDAAKIKIRLLMDKFSCEVFVNDGYSAMTAAVAPYDNQIKTCVFSDKAANVLLTRHKISV